MTEKFYRRVAIACIILAVVGISLGVAFPHLFKKLIKSVSVWSEKKIGMKPDLVFVCVCFFLLSANQFETRFGLPQNVGEISNLHKVFNLCFQCHKSARGTGWWQAQTARSGAICVWVRKGGLRTPRFQYFYPVKQNCFFLINKFTKYWFPENGKINTTLRISKKRMPWSSPWEIHLFFAPIWVWAVRRWLHFHIPWCRWKIKKWKWEIFKTTSPILKFPNII